MTLGKAGLKKFNQDIKKRKFYNLPILFFVFSLFLSITPLNPKDNRAIRLEKLSVSLLPDENIAPNLGSISIDTKGNVFAFAGQQGSKECFVVKFDENLKFLKRFGREGKGPGEFSMVVSSYEDRLMIMAGGDVYVIDNNPTRFVVFDNDGNYKKDIPYRRDYYNYFGHIIKFKALGDDSIAGIKYVHEKPYVGVILSLNPPRIVANYHYSGEVLKLHIPNFHGQIWSRIYGHIPLIDTDIQHVVFCDPQVYKFQVFDTEGKLILEVQDQKRRVRNFSNKEMKKIIYDKYTIKKENTTLKNKFIKDFISKKSIFKSVLATIQKNKNVITDIHVSDKRIYVFPVSEDITVKNHNPVEIYDLKGKLVRRGYFKEIPVEIWKDYAFFCGRDKEDNPIIIKYKILD